MWIICKSGFLSVVQNRDAVGPDEALLVRARVRVDLEDFVREIGGRAVVVEMPKADYRFRCYASRADLAAYLAVRVASIDYPNFKDAIARVDEPRAFVFGRVWATLRELMPLG